MKRKTEMRIMLFLLNIIILTSLIITSANASNLVDDRFQRDQRVDRFQYDSPQGYGGEIKNVAGKVNMNDGYGEGVEIYNVAGNVNINSGYGEGPEGRVNAPVNCDDGNPCTVDAYSKNGCDNAPVKCSHKQLGVDAWYGTFWYTEVYTPKWPQNL